MAYLIETIKAFFCYSRGRPFVLTPTTLVGGRENNAKALISGRASKLWNWKNEVRLPFDIVYPLTGSG
jgi:hypothetical protein